jgi:hypothetical protein
MLFDNPLNNKITEIDGYPVVKVYKYLGYFINDSLSIMSHQK